MSLNEVTSAANDSSNYLKNQVTQINSIQAQNLQEQKQKQQLLGQNQVHSDAQLSNKMTAAIGQHTSA